MERAFSDTLEQLRQLDLSGREFRQACMECLSRLDGYDWCGVYALETVDGQRALVLDCFVGAATEHVRIEVGQGVCGTAVAENANQVVGDVRALENYLACSLETRSEIVVLIREPSSLESEASILGQIDVDSHTPGRFGKADEVFLDAMGALIAQRW